MSIRVHSSFVAFAVVALLSTNAASISAQGTDSARLPTKVGRGAQAKLPRRAVVEKLQQRVDNLLRVRLELTDEQFTKMQALNTRLDEEKRAQRAEEGDVRRALRAELLPGATPNDATIAELLDKLPVVERKRIALQEREQKELAGFMKPAQRARFFALQDELRRSLQEVQRLRGRGGLPDDGVGPPPPLLRRGGRGMRPPPS